mmetsp:Transcript_10592/g.31864  ORF Transcript_10592/g.31864 Transcript_10592/m.31864 type:complete len:239 (+) Transcript_10592:316-1032(+)
MVPRGRHGQAPCRFHVAQTRGQTTAAGGLRSGAASSGAPGEGEGRAEDPDEGRRQAGPDHLGKVPTAGAGGQDRGGAGATGEVATAARGSTGPVAAGGHPGSGGDLRRLQAPPLAVRAAQQGVPAGRPRGRWSRPAAAAAPLGPREAAEHRCGALPGRLQPCRLWYGLRSAVPQDRPGDKRANARRQDRPRAAAPEESVPQDGGLQALPVLGAWSCEQAQRRHRREHPDLPHGLPDPV